MKKLIGIKLLLILILFSACQNLDKTKEKSSQSKTALKYTCSMHPQVIVDHPGNCPICNMELVPVKHQQNSTGLDLSKEQILLGNIKTMKVGISNLSAQQWINASLTFDAEKTATLTSKFPGRIDRLYFKETGVEVVKGQALYRIYSEELLSLEEDYLLNLKQSETFPHDKIYQKLTKSAAQKLILYGLSPVQIKALEKGEFNKAYITVYAPQSGLISAINISEGQYVMEGSPILTLENLNQLWLEADIYPSENNRVSLGKNIVVRVNGFENETIKTQINFINPQYSGESQILKFRASIPNPSLKFQPGMQASVSLNYQNHQNVLTLPINAVMREENGAMVWVKTNQGHFEMRNVILGAENDQAVVIENGIKKGDEVVVNGAYLLTSEYTLKKGSNSMAGMNM